MHRDTNTCQHAVGLVRSPALVVFLSVFAAQGCCEQGSGNVVKMVREVSDIRDLRVEIPASIRVVDGPPGILRIETDDNLIDRISIDDDDGTLELQLDDDCCIEPTVLDVTITASALRSLSIDGSADVSFETALAGESFELDIDGSGTITSALPLAFETIDVEIDGSGTIEAEVDATKVVSNIDGSADLVLSGRTVEHHSCVDGSATVEAFAMQTDVTALVIDGSAYFEVSASERLDVNIDGSASVSYCGAPTLERSIDGSGSIQAANSSRCP